MARLSRGFLNGGVTAVPIETAWSLFSVATGNWKHRWKISRFNRICLQVNGGDMGRLLYMRVGGNPCYGITCDMKVNAGCVRIVRNGSLAPP
jgi:hypothetical protein